MITTFTDPKQASELFINMLIARSYDGVIKDTLTMLEKGSRLRSHEQNSLHVWFESIDKETRENVLRIIEKSVHAAVFGYLVLLDSMTGGNPIKDQISDFAIYLQVYQDEDRREADLTESKIRLNPPNTSEYLHDIFQRILHERIGH